MASRELTNLVEELKALACVDDVVWVAHSEVIEQVKQYGGEPPVTNMCATVHYRGVRKLKL